MADWVSFENSSHSLRVWKKHLTKRYGSVVGAWRQKFGLIRLVPFSKFRDLCKETKEWPHATEYWQEKLRRHESLHFDELDIGRGGTISLFELDPQMLCILAIFRARLVKLAGTAEPNPEDTGGAVGWNGPLWRQLDSEGGHTFNPPGHVRPTDIAWLCKLPMLVDLNAIALKPGGFDTQEVIPKPRSYAAIRSPSNFSPAIPGSLASPDSSGSDHDDEPPVLGAPATPPGAPQTPQTPPTPQPEPVSASRPLRERTKTEEMPVKKAASFKEAEAPIAAPAAVTAAQAAEPAASPSAPPEMEVDDHSDYYGEDGEEEDEEEEFEMDLSALQQVEDETF
eukprot:g3058.t1